MVLVSGEDGAALETSPALPPYPGGDDRRGKVSIWDFGEWREEDRQDEKAIDKPEGKYSDSNGGNEGRHRYTGEEPHGVCRRGWPLNCRCLPFTILDPDLKSLIRWWSLCPSTSAFSTSDKACTLSRISWALPNPESANASRRKGREKFDTKIVLQSY